MRFFSTVGPVYVGEFVSGLDHREDLFLETNVG
jgi:hypothetical protein